MKKENNEITSLNEEWDLDASASDNESFEMEMMQNQSIKVHSEKTDSEEK